MTSRHRDHRPARFRVGALLFALATACGLWFGVTAPDVSPVAPDAVGQGAPGPTTGEQP